MTLGEIIRTYRKDHRMSMEEFAKLANMSKQYVSILERNYNPSSGRAPKPTLDTIAAVANAMGENLNNVFAKLDGETTINLSSIPGISAMPKFSAKPRLGAIACGVPILAEENLEGYDQVPDYIHCDFTLVCKGDSMINARIFDGDIVCIRQQPEVENGEIAAVLIDDEATLKRVKRFEDHIVLEPENPLYRPIVFWGEEMGKVHILGKATHFISTVR